jgi:hypothetical protein
VAKDVTIRILGDSSSATNALNDVEGKTNKFGTNMKSILGAVGGVALAKGVFEFAKGSVEAFKESEDSANRLQDAFAKFPKLADSNIADFQKLNTALAKKTKFDDDATASGQAVLAQFGLTGAQIEQLTPLLQDYAAKTGKDIPSAADALGKAMLGKGKALQEIGIKFKDTGSLAGNFDQTIGGLRSQVGGFAEKEGQTAAGKAEILKNQFGELQETVGSKLMPVLTTLSDWLLTAINFLGDLSPGVQTAIGVVVGLAAAAFVVVQAVQAWTAVQAALNVVMSMNPIGLVVIAIAALVAGIIWAYAHVGWFRDGVQATFKFLGDAAVWLGGVFAAVWDGIVAGFRWVRDTLKSIANWIGQNIINPVIEGVNQVIRGVNIVNPGKDVPQIAKIPSFDKGGIVPGAPGAPMLAVVHGGEEFSGVGQSLRGGGGVTVIIEGDVYSDDRSFADKVAAALEGRFARGAALGNGQAVGCWRRASGAALPTACC